MRKNRFILHSDLTNFYASVECMENPELEKVALVICGDASKRHGVVLAKNNLAKSLGVKTGDVIWEAKEKCRGVEFKAITANFDKYNAISKKVKAIYKEHSDKVESFGIDEAWIDISKTVSTWKDAIEIAEIIYNQVLKECGLVVYIGLSFNKIFAKLGSDLKEADHISVITPGDFQYKIWPLPVSKLLFVGSKTEKKLEKLNIKTIGDLALAPIHSLELILGKNGRTLWEFANGLDSSEVLNANEHYPIKSIGNSVTCPVDLKTHKQIESVVFTLCETIIARARKHGVWAKEVQVFIKTNNLLSFERQAKLPYPISNVQDLAENALKLINSCYDWKLPIRALGVRIKDFSDQPTQINMFFNFKELEKKENLDKTVEKLRNKYGNNIIKRAVVMQTQELRLIDPSSTAHEIHPISYKV